jgi:hypothetical protein
MQPGCLKWRFAQWNEGVGLGKLELNSHAESCLKGMAKEEAEKMEMIQVHEFRGNKKTPVSRRLLGMP